MSSMSDAVMRGVAVGAVMIAVHLLASALNWIRTTLTRYVRRRIAHGAPRPALMSTFVSSVARGAAFRA